MSLAAEDCHDICAVEICLDNKNTVLAPERKPQIQQISCSIISSIRKKACLLLLTEFWQIFMAPPEVHVFRCLVAVPV
jgi:hypothetical protein